MLQVFKSIPLCALLLSSACNGDKDYQINELNPDLVVAPESIEFGGVTVLYDADETLQIINAGRAPLEIDRIYVEGYEGSIYTLSLLVTEDAPLTVEADESVTLNVNFKPDTYLDYSADLVIVSNDPEDPELRVPIVAEGVDGPVPNINVSPLSIDFGEVITGVQAGPVPLTIENTGDGDLYIGTTTQKGSGAFTLSSDPELYTIGAGQTTTLLVYYTPEQDLGDNGSFIIESNDPLTPAVEVYFLGNGGGDFEYPIAVIKDCLPEVDPPDVLTLDGSESSDPMGGELTYEWTLAEKPEGSDGEIANPSAELTSVNVDAAGDWRVSLTVTNELGISSAPTECAFDAVPDEKVYVQLTWDTGNSDVDLHLVQYGYEIFQYPGDATWCNPNPSWGESTVDDDPNLSLDNRVGYGPETITLFEPYEGDYDIYVHYFSDNGGGTTTATVKVFIDGEEFYSDSQAMESNQVWEVGYIRWPDAVVVPLDTDLYKLTLQPRDCYSP